MLIMLRVIFSQVQKISYLNLTILAAAGLCVLQEAPCDWQKLKELLETGLSLQMKTTNSGTEYVDALRHLSELIWTPLNRTGLGSYNLDLSDV